MGDGDLSLVIDRLLLYRQTVMEPCTMDPLLQLLVKSTPVNLALANQKAPKHIQQIGAFVSQYRRRSFLKFFDALQLVRRPPRINPPRP
jgi:hypothetical protein